MADQHSTRMEAARHILRHRLDNAVADRDPLADDTPAGTEPAWLVHERHVMHTAVNDIRAGYGLPPVALAVVEQIDTSAAGHADWAERFAIRCADVAVGEDDRG